MEWLEMKKKRTDLLKLNEALDEVHFKSYCQLKTYSPVLQIISKFHNEILFVCVRQKNYLSLFRSSDMDFLPQPVRLWRKKVSGSKLLTCVDVQPSCEEIIATDSSYDINVFNIERKSKLYGHSGKKYSSGLVNDSWSQVSFGDHGIYWSLRQCFFIFDIRDFASGAKLKFSLSSATNKCENICSFVQSPSDSNFLYLGTTHNVLQVDLRNGKPVQRWTHQMKNPPQFMSVAKEGDRNEVLVVQSPSVDEIAGIVNEQVNGGDDGVNLLSASLPCLLKSVKESLNLARFHGICLKPFAAKRLNFSVTGLQVVKNSEGDIIVFVKNGGGDVFRSKLQKKTSNSDLSEKDEQELLNAMKMFETNFERFPFKEIIKSRVEFINMKPVIEGIKQSQIKSKKQGKPDIYWKYHEMYSPESLVFCKDILAQKILNVWGHHREESDLHNVVMSVDDKVREWMEKY